MDYRNVLMFQALIGLNPSHPLNGWSRDKMLRKFRQRVDIVSNNPIHYGYYWCGCFKFSSRSWLAFPVSDYTKIAQTPMERGFAGSD